MIPFMRSLLMAVVPGPVGAQGTIQQQLCVSFTITPGSVIGPANLVDLITSGAVTVDAVGPAAACIPETPVTGDYDLWTAFIAREAAAETRYGELSDQVMAAIDDGKYSNVGKRSTTTADFLKREIAWLDDNEPAACYVDAWQGYRDAWSMYRKAFTDLAYGAKHETSAGLDRLSRATDELTEANSLYDDIDLDSVDCSR